MLQTIITLIIVISAIVFAVIKIYRSVFKRKSGCNGCSSSYCDDCPLGELKNIQKNQKEEVK